METPLEDLSLEVGILLKWISQELYRSLDWIYLDQSIDEW
jgi:hypothetical protein